jgi:hypothetical protein
VDTARGAVNLVEALLVTSKRCQSLDARAQRRRWESWSLMRPGRNLSERLRSLRAQVGRVRADTRRLIAQPVMCRRAARNGNDQRADGSGVSGDATHVAKRTDVVGVHLRQDRERCMSSPSPPRSPRLGIARSGSDEVGDVLHCRRSHPGATLCTRERSAAPTAALAMRPVWCSTRRLRSRSTDHDGPAHVPPVSRLRCGC